MHRSDFIYTAILLPLDYLMLILAGLLSYNIRKSEFIKNLDIVSDVFYQLPSRTYLEFVAIMSLVWILFFSIAGLYNQREIKKFINQIVRVFLACTAGISAIIIFLFFKREFLFSSRFIILAGWSMSIFFIVFARGVVRVIRRVLLKFQIGARPIIVVGGDINTKHFIDRIKNNTFWGYNVVRKVSTLDQLKRKIKETNVCEVILPDLNYSREKVNSFLEFCQTHHLDFKYAPDIFSAHLHNIEMDAVAGFPFIEIKRTPLEGWGRVKKRIVDIILGILAIIIFFIPGIIIAIAIKLTSKGPVFVKLTRVGEGGKMFKLYKFRSMVKDAHKLKKELLSYNERKGPLFKIKNDPRVTKVGRFLRRFSLDEIPNFYNVLMGNMSLVGPRPHEPEEVRQYKEYQKKLLNIKPGITGLAQISGRSNLDFDEEARLDLYYVENWNLKMDFSILLKTPFAVLKREGAA